MTDDPRQLRPLSVAAKEMRRLPHPTAFLLAEHDRPDLPPTKTRVARVVRVPLMKEKGDGH
jgi:hypothetical protein